MRGGGTGERERERGARERSERRGNEGREGNEKRTRERILFNMTKQICNLQSPLCQLFTRERRQLLEYDGDKS
jgi:hypothetical protein